MSEQSENERLSAQVPIEPVDAQALSVTRQIQKTTEHAEFHSTVQSLRRSRTVEYFLFIVVAVVLIGVVWGQQRSNTELRQNLYNNCVTGNADSQRRNQVYVAIAHQLHQDSTARRTLLDAVQALNPHNCHIYLEK